MSLATAVNLASLEYFEMTALAEPLATTNARAAEDHSDSDVLQGSASGWLVTGPGSPPGGHFFNRASDPPASALQVGYRPGGPGPAWGLTLQWAAAASGPTGPASGTVTVTTPGPPVRRKWRWGHLLLVVGWCPPTCPGPFQRDVTTAGPGAGDRHGHWHPARVTVTVANAQGC